jgi:hypothetical protein
MTKPLIHAVNNATVGRHVAYLDFIEIEVVTAGATGAQACWAAQLDTGATRITTPGTALTAVNPNMQSTATRSSPRLRPARSSSARSRRAFATSTTARTVRRSRSPATSTSSCSAGTRRRLARSRPWPRSVRNFVTDLGSAHPRPDRLQFLLALHSQSPERGRRLQDAHGLVGALGDRPDVN